MIPHPFATTEQGGCCIYWTMLKAYKN